MKDAIVIRGARQHNLKNLNLEIPRRAMTVITGPSGSGKSSLAFDTIYAEGQRRYVESLSAYARQFLERMEKPDVDKIEGIAPAIAIRQKNSVRNPRSTVGTTTEIHDYMRLLFARTGRTVLQVIVDRVQVSGDDPDALRQRITDSIETAYREGSGAAWAVEQPRTATEATGNVTAPVVHKFSERFECRVCGIAYEDPQ